MIVTQRQAFMNVPFLDLKRRTDPDCLNAVERAVRSGRFIDGPELAGFERAFADYCGVAECVGTANGTDALELALRALNVGPGDEVATVANAGMYATTAIRAVGAIPLLVDVEDESLLMDPAALEHALAAATKAVIVTHLYGRLAPMEALGAVAGRRGIPLVEDCAQAHGAERDGHKAGSWGSLGCFSFYPTKNLGALGDAGAVVTGDPDLAQRLRALRQYGWTAKRFHSTLPGGRNSRMDELQAAVLSERLPFLDGWNDRRRAIARRYTEALAACSFYRAPAVPEDGYVAHLYVLRCGERDRVRAALAARGVQTEVHYPVLDHRQESQAALGFRVGDLEASERAAAEVLSLPCYPELAAEEGKVVIESLLENAKERLTMFVNVAAKLQQSP